MSAVLTLRAEPLTADAFAAFGDVIETAGRDSFQINQGMADRYHDLARVETLGADARTAVSWVHARPEQAPVTLRLMERHPHGSQIFMPLGPQPFIVVVAAGTEPPARDTLRAFVSNGHQGVNYRRGVWHHPMIALEAPTDFLVVDREGERPNCDEVAIAGGAVAVTL